MKAKKGEKFRTNAPVVRQETFSDGSRLSELADGAFILQETSHAVQPYVEQPAPYNQTAAETEAEGRIIVAKAGHSGRPARTGSPPGA